MNMLKSLAMVLACSLAYLASADNLERFVPAGTNVLGKLRPRMLLDLSAVKDSDHAEVKKWRETIEKYNIFGGGGLPTQALVISTVKYDKSVAVIVPVINTSEEMKVQLDKLAQDFPGMFTVAELPSKDYSGHKVIVNNDGKKSSIEIYYLEKDVAALTFDGSFPPGELKAGEKPAPILDQFKDIGELEMLRVATLGVDFDQKPGAMQGLTGIMVKASKSTDEKVAIIINSVLEFDKPESAMLFTFSLQFGLSATILQVTNDGQLAEQVGREVKVRADGNKAFIDATISEALVNALKDKFQNQIPSAAPGTVKEEVKIEVIETKTTTTEK